MPWLLLDATASVGGWGFKSSVERTACRGFLLKIILTTAPFGGGDDGVVVAAAVDLGVGLCSCCWCWYC